MYKYLTFGKIVYIRPFIFELHRNNKIYLVKCVEIPVFPNIFFGFFSSILKSNRKYKCNTFDPQVLFKLNSPLEIILEGFQN
jgi:hypothetical protein